MIINGYTNYPDNNNSVYLEMESYKNINRDKYFGVNNRNKNKIDTTIDNREELYIDTNIEY